MGVERKTATTDAWVYIKGFGLPIRMRGGAEFNQLFGESRLEGFFDLLK